MNIKYEYLPKILIKDTNLTLSQKKVAYELFHLSGWEDDNILPSASSLAKKLNIKDHKTVAKAYKILEEKDYLRINEDKTFKFYINGAYVEKTDFSSRFLCEMAGNFVVVPTNILYYPEITPSELDSYIKFFDRNFKIEDGKFQMKNNSITTANIVAKEWECDERTMQQNLKNLKEKGILDYQVVENVNCQGNSGKKYVSFKFFQIEQVWIIHNGKTAKKGTTTITTQEKVVSAEQKLENELLGKEEYVPTDEEVKLRDDLLSNITKAGKRDWDNRQIYNSRVDEQIIWLRKRQVA